MAQLAEKPLSYKMQRTMMVRRQLKGRRIKDVAVLRAMAAVPRERFVLDKYRSLAYANSPLPILEDQTISQPYIVAFMLETLDLRPTDRVLEIGTGSGYASAVLSRIVAEVYTVERHEMLVEYAKTRIRNLGYSNVCFKHDDGTLGWQEFAPYDAILVSAGGPSVPSLLKDQLEIGGRLVMPVGDATHFQTLVLVVRHDETEFQYEELGDVSFVPLVGTEGWVGAESQ